MLNDINWKALMQAILVTLLIVIGIPALGIGIILLLAWIVLHHLLSLFSILIFGSIIIGMVKLLYDDFN